MALIPAGFEVALIHNRGGLSSLRCADLAGGGGAVVECGARRIPLAQGRES